MAESVLSSPPTPEAATHPVGRASSKQILDLTRNHVRSAGVATAVAVVNRMFEAAPSAMIGAAGDIVAGRPSRFFGWLGLRTSSSQLWGLGGLSALVWIADSVMGYLHSYTSGALAGQVRRDLHDRAYTHLQTLDLAQLEARPLNEWISLIRNDSGRIAHFIEEGVDPFVTMLTNGVTVFGIYLRSSPSLALIQLLAMPVLFLVSTLLLKPIRERQEQARQHEDQVNSAVLGNVTGMSTISSFGRQQAEADRISRLGVKAMESARHTAVLSAAYVPAIQLVVAGAFLATLIRGGSLVKQGRISITLYNVMGFANLRLFNALARLGVSVEHFQRTRVSFDRLIRMLETRSTIPSGDRPLAPSSVSGEIVFEDVTFHYVPQRQPALHRLSLHIPAGKTTAIVGATGSGKTTLQKLLLRFADHQSGSIRLDGVDIREYRIEDLRSCIAAVPQQTFLFDGTVRENLAYARPEASMEEIVRAATAAQCDGFIRQLPDSYDTYIGENGSKLSGGQRQRLAIARAVLASRPIWVFDEATSAVDYETEAAIQQSLRRLGGERTILIAAHRLSTVRDADVIYVLNEGKVAEKGTHQRLLAADGLYAGLWRIQTGEFGTKELPPPKTRRASTKKRPT